MAKINFNKQETIITKGLIDQAISQAHEDMPDEILIDGDPVLANLSRLIKLAEEIDVDKNNTDSIQGMKDNFQKLLSERKEGYRIWRDSIHPTLESISAKLNIAELEEEK